MLVKGLTKKSVRSGWRFAAVLLIAGVPAQGWAQVVVPGTGQKLEQVGDDFEDPKWYFDLRLPKSSSNIDESSRYPTGVSNNARWIESGYRGTPDVVKRVATPPGGLPGSEGAMLIQTLQTGIPGRPSGEMQQDDLLLSVLGRIGGGMPVAWSPNFVTRVYLPEWDQWENRVGSTFGIRADAITTIRKGEATGSKKKRGFFARIANTSRYESEAYWPGMFIQFNSAHDGRYKEDSAVILVRGDQYGHEITGPVITEPGWWTFGISLSPDGRVHFFAKPGTGDLTMADLITSQYPYGYRAERCNTFFFNVVNNDDGRTWSTPWIIDDPTIYVNR